MNITKPTRNVNVITDLDGTKIVIINDIYFRGRQNIAWHDVERYLMKYIGDMYEVVETADKIYIGKDFPDEYAGSIYTRQLRGTVAKAKANASQGIPELIEIANEKDFQDNMSSKHIKDAKNGWYHYDIRFGLPVVDTYGEIIRYNIFCAQLLVRHDENGKLYLYDIVNIKKKRSNPL